MSYYPPGVTGTEYAIAGPDYERLTDEYCEWCKDWTEGFEQGYGYDRWFICGECNRSTDLKPADMYDFGPDPDEAYDRMIGN